MAKYDQGGGCACGLHRECACHDEAARQHVEAGKPMTGFLAGLTADQKEAALAYDGPETHGDVYGAGLRGAAIAASRSVASTVHVKIPDNDNFTADDARRAVGLTGKEAAERTMTRFPNVMAGLATKSGFVYLGSPYSKWADKDAAAKIVATAAGHLMEFGVPVFAPIAHGHFVSGHADLPNDWDFWKAQCQPMIDAAESLIVLTTDGWDESVGLQYEIEEFRRAGKLVVYMSPAQIQRQAQQRRRAA